MTNMRRETGMGRWFSPISPWAAITQAALISLAVLCSSLLAKGQAPPRELVKPICTSDDCSSKIFCRMGSGELPEKPLKPDDFPRGFDVYTPDNSRVVAITYSALRVSPHGKRNTSCTVSVKLGFPASFATPEMLVVTNGDAWLEEGVSAEVRWNYYFSGEEAEFVESLASPFDSPIHRTHGLGELDAVKIRTHLEVLPASESDKSGHVQVRNQEVIFLWG